MLPNVVLVIAICISVVANAFGDVTADPLVTAAFTPADGARGGRDQFAFGEEGLKHLGASIAKVSR
jgi:hypothetical protein